MSETLRRVAAALDTGQFISGETLADRLGCSRAAVWKHIASLRDLGIELEAERGRGYRLAHELELLEPERIRAAAGAAGQSLLGIEVTLETGSTNQDLLQREAGQRHARALIAERQTAGRGRRGRVWQSPFGRNIYLSLGWRFEAGLAELGFLPLAVAVAVARAMHGVGVTAPQIKWPNDLLIEGRKVAGCLVEVRGDVSGPCLAVMGVGLNLRMDGTEEADRIDQPWTDLANHVPTVGRNVVAGTLLGALSEAAESFAKHGFEPFAEDWRRWDQVRGCDVVLRLAQGEIRGRVSGLGPRGGLLLNVDGKEQEVVAGEVSIRVAPSIRGGP